MLTVDDMFSTLSKADEAWCNVRDRFIPWKDATGNSIRINLTDLAIDAAEILAHRGPIYGLGLAARLEHLHRYQNPNIAVGIFAMGRGCDPRLIERTSTRLAAQLRSNRYADQFCHCWHKLMEPEPTKRQYVMQDLMRASLARMLGDVIVQNIPINWPADKDIYNECVPEMMSEETFLKAAMSWANSRSSRERGNALTNLNGMERSAPQSLSPIAAQYKSALQNASGDVLQRPFPKSVEPANPAAASIPTSNPKVDRQKTLSSRAAQPPNFGNNRKPAFAPGIIQFRGDKGQLRGGL